MERKSIQYGENVFIFGEIKTFERIKDSMYK